MEKVPVGEVGSQFLVEAKITVVQSRPFNCTLDKTCPSCCFFSSFFVFFRLFSSFFVFLCHKYKCSVFSFESNKCHNCAVWNLK